MTENPKRRGFTIMEMLLALTIVAMVLASIAAAVHASLHGYTENEKLTTATQTGRVVLGRMTREIRTCTDLDSDGASVTIIPPNDGSGVAQIVYEISEGQLVCCRTMSDGSKNTSTLIGGPGDDTTLVSFYVLREDDATGEPVSATIRLDFRVSDQPFGMTTSAALRKTQFN
jgi:prepilin-type N-terminal cleavage/methylation domain-containing protein